MIERLCRGADYESWGDWLAVLAQTRSVASRRGWLTPTPPPRTKRTIQHQGNVVDRHKPTIGPTIEHALREWISVLARSKICVAAELLRSTLSSGQSSPIPADAIAANAVFKGIRVRSISQVSRWTQEHTCSQPRRRCIGAVNEFSIRKDSCSDSCPEREKDEIIHPASSTDPVLTQGPDSYIILDRSGTRSGFEERRNGTSFQPRNKKWPRRRPP